MIIAGILLAICFIGNKYLDYKAKKYCEKTTSSGKKMSKVVDEKQVVFYSEKYAIKARKDREATLKKAMDLIASPSKYNRSTSYGAAEYVKNISFDKETGEVITTGKVLALDIDRIKEEESFRVTKSDLEARLVTGPHTSLCFVSLVVARILELNTKHKYSIRKLLTLGKIKKILGNTKKGVVTL